MKATYRPIILIPRHKELAQGTLRRAIKQAGATIEQFVDVYNQRQIRLQDLSESSRWPEPE